MWAYTICENRWLSKKSMTKNKSFWRKNKTIILMCTVPTVTLLWMISLVF